MHDETLTHGGSSECVKLGGSGKGLSAMEVENVSISAQFNV